MQKILIVEGEQENLDHTTHQLKTVFNCEVHGFLNARCAHDWSQNNHFDLGVVGQGDFGTLAVDFIRTIRQQTRHKDSLFLVLLGNDLSVDFTQDFDLGGVGYVPLPLDMEKGLRVLRGLLSEENADSALRPEHLSPKQPLNDVTQYLQENEERFRLAFDATQEGVWDWDLETGSIFYSAYWCQMLGYSQTEVPSTPDFWMEAVHPEDSYGLRLAIEDYIAGNSSLLDHECRLIHRKGGDVWVRLKGKGVRAESGKMVRLVGTQSDISELKAVHEQLSHSALHDMLTGLPNRSLFNERLKQAFARFKRNEENHFSVLFIDLDEFKEINDSYGHASGDKILVEVTKILQKCTRDVDTVARFGGDEFAILLEKTSHKEEIQVYINRFYQEAQKSVTLDQDRIKLHFSVGITSVDPSHFSYNAVMKEADLALYQAKEAGRNQAVFYDNDVQEISPRRREILASLGSALTNKEIEIYYQPIVCLKTQKPLGYESLLRWHHPTMGIINPEDFIPIAEKNDMIVRLGTFVMQGAIEQLSVWQKKYNDPNLFMCINVTSAQVFCSDYLAVLSQFCMQQAIKPDHVILEFSEVSFAEIYKWDGSALSEIKQAGFHIALDDYGESRASIRSLVDYQMDYLKIDRSLSLQLLTDERKRHLFDLMIHLGTKRNLQIIVEGIQTQEILEYVIQSKAQMGQGYLFSRPCPVVEIEKFLESS